MNMTRVAVPVLQLRFFSAIALLAACLTLPVRLVAQEHHLNLDELSSAQLQSALDAELGDDDLRQFGIEPSRAYPIEKLHAAILSALSDEGDEDDEQIITQDELDEEMAEVGTDLPQVIWDALVRADQLASVGAVTNPLRRAGRFLAREDGLTSGSAGATQAKLAVRMTIQRVKK